ncbi:MAG: PAS domain-containing sensor histidine kinase [Gammaproteobacteria bacterium]|nr:PAS domain-containing sensor histidine kinase [Gammaproteobacteria bacterium]
MSSKKPPHGSEQHILVESQLTAMVHQHIPAGIVATLFNGSVILYALWGTISSFTLLLWFGLVTAINSGRLLEVYLYRRIKPSAEDSVVWAKWFTLGAILAGAGWGFASLWLIPADSIAHQMIIIIIVAGTVAGSTSTLAPLAKAFIPFCLLSVIPLTIKLFLLDGEVHTLIAVVSIVFTLFMISAGKINRQNLITSLTLTYENNNLLGKLETEKQQATNLNKTLKNEIGQRIDAEILLKKRELSLEDAQRIAKMGSWESNIETRQVSLSNVMKSLFGFSPEQDSVSAISFLNKIIAADRIRVDQARNDAMNHLRSYQIEYQVSGENGKNRIFEEQGVVRIDKSGSASGLAAIVLDITHRKETDKLKNDFISTVSHELRTPLTSISGTLSLLESNTIVPLPDKAHHLVSLAHRNALRLTHLVNDILDIDRLGFGGLPLELKPVDLVRIVNDAIEENQGYAENLHVKIKLSDPPESIYIYGDTERLNQVLTNFLSNAAKYSPQDDIVTVSILPTKDRVRIEVRDNGPGIEKAFHDKVFQKFSQGDTSDSRFQYGSGLGLSIAKLIIDKHHGKIGFDTEVGEGTSFWFELPLDEKK